MHHYKNGHTCRARVSVFESGFSRRFRSGICRRSLLGRRGGGLGALELVIVDHQICALEGSIQLAHCPQIFRAALLIRCGLEIVLHRHGGNGAGNDGQLAQGGIAVFIQHHFLLEHSGIQIQGEVVSAKGEVAQGIEDHSILVVLDGLEGVG